MFGTKQVAVAEVGREPREHPMGITALSIPALQAMNGKGVTEIVAPGTDASMGRLQAAATKQNAQVLEVFLTERRRPSSCAKTKGSAWRRAQS
jgi:hypothetical protein